MKKFGKFIFGTVSIATLAGGAYYLYKNVLNKDTTDDFDDFEDDFEDFDTEEDTPVSDKKETREYVSINITSDTQDTVTEEETSEEKEEETASTEE